MGPIRRVVAQAAAGLVVIGAASGGWFFAAGTSADDTATQAAASDAARVFCLSSEQRTPLAEAATNLGVTLPEGRLRGQGPEFDRVCAALMGANRVPHQVASVSSNSKPTFDVLLSVIVGALLAWLTGFWRDERTQSRLLADTLRDAARRYLSAAHAQRRKWFEGRQGMLPVDQVVLDGRDELAGQLRKVAALRPSWTVPGLLHEQLCSVRLGEGMNDPRPGESRDQRDEVLRDNLKTLTDSIDGVVRALERPWRWHGDMRAKHPGGLKATSAG
ncbi:MAG: hypothetical protein ACRDQU_17235 [Pseudonocardiaceae bacterium]